MVKLTSRLAFCLFLLFCYFPFFLVTIHVIMRQVRLWWSSRTLSVHWPVHQFFQPFYTLTSEEWPLRNKQKQWSYFSFPHQYRDLERLKVGRHIELSNINPKTPPPCLVSFLLPSFEGSLFVNLQITVSYSLLKYVCLSWYQTIIDMS